MGEIVDLIKKANKDKLIQLVIDSKEVDMEGVPEELRKLTEDEIDLIFKRAGDEGWIGELKRAKGKARDIEKLSYKAQVELWKALYYLQEFTQLLHKTEVILKVLSGNNLDWKGEEVMAKGKKTKKEIEKEVEEVVSNTLIVTLSSVATQLKAKMLGSNRGKIFNLYKYYFSNAKLLTHLVVSPVIDGYRLYAKETVEELELGLSFVNLISVMGVIDSLEHIDYLQENLNKCTPEIIEALKKHEDRLIYLPTKEEIREFVDYLEEKALYQPAVEELNKTLDTVGKPKVFDKEYLLNEAKEKEIKDIEEQDKVLKEYIRYGK